MRELHPNLAAHLASGVTTLCTCWKAIRRDGAVFGFADHDRDLEFDGLVFRAGSGLRGSSSQANLGLAIGGSEIGGVLSSNDIAEQDLAAGLFDAARIEVWRVNWGDVAQRALVDIHVIGEVTRTASGFTAELRALTHAFDQEVGGTYQKRCSATLGDARCGVDLDAPALSSLAILLAQEGASALRLQSFAFAPGAFDGGFISIVGGGHDGMRAMIESCRPAQDDVRLSLWDPLPFALPAGTNLKLTAGCDGAFSTCRTRFSNQLNHRGFPHIPGNEVLMANAATTSQRMDGGSLFK